MPLCGLSKEDTISLCRLRVDKQYYSINIDDSDGNRKIKQLVHRVRIRINKRSHEWS
jgi:hypothetical protein